MSVPTGIEGITPGWLTSILSEQHPAVKVDGVQVLAATEGTAHRLSLGLQYAEGGAGGLPPQIFAKTIVAEDNLAWASMFRTELDFYQRIRGALEIETPQVYAVRRDEGSDRFVVLMEDLALRHAQFLDCTKAVSLDDAAAIVTTLARLHAPHWGSASLGTDFAFLETPNDGGNYENFVNLGPVILHSEMESDLKARMAYEVGRPLEQMWKAFARMADLDAAATPTLTHGDVHVGNTYLLPDGTGGLVDWQFARRCHGVHDISYFLMTALDTELRRAGERDLLTLYRDELSANGVRDVDADELFTLYRQDALWGVVMWLLTPSGMHREEILETAFRRCLRATEDLETFRLLEA